MPQETQIVPAYLQPHVSVVINDNSGYTDEVAAEVDDNVKMLCVFRSGMGPDNVIIKKTSVKDFTTTYGSSDYAKYGQPLMMPIAALTSGYASVYAMRVMPDDATYANAVLSVLYKSDAESGKFTVKIASEYIENGSKVADVKAGAAALASDTPDEKGFKKIPVAVITMAGRGDYGNKFRFRISRDTLYEKDYGIKMYDFEAISTTGGLAKVATYVGSIVTSPKYNETTLITDVIESKDVGSSYFNIDVDETAVEKVYNEFVKFVDGLTSEKKGDIPELDEFDLFFGKLINSDETYKNYEVISTDDADDSIVGVDAAEGITLAGGDEGSFASGTAEDIASAISQAYVDAFNGTLDKSVLSTKRAPYDILLDANYPFAVKQAMYALNTARADGILHLDAGIITSTAELSNAIKDYAEFNNRYTSKEFQHYMIRDPQTKKKVAVTTTYFLAQRLPAHIRNNGGHIPFVKNYATLTGHVKNSLEPAIELIDMDLKEQLYINRFNYYETIAEDTFARSVQNTAQMNDSDLLEESNVRTLLTLKRELEDDCQANLYNFADANVREAFTNYQTAKYRSWIGSKVQSLSISFDMNEWEMERSILHCYVAVQFRTLAKRTIIEIDVNKRTLSV